MSDSKMVDFYCPRCGAPGEVCIYTSVNVTLDPHLKEEIFSDELNTFECAKCGATGFQESCVLYHDMHRRIAVWFEPNGCDASETKRALQVMTRAAGNGEHLANAPATNNWETFKKTIREQTFQADHAHFIESADDGNDVFYSFLKANGIEMTSFFSSVCLTSPSFIARDLSKPFDISCLDIPSDANAMFLFMFLEFAHMLPADKRKALYRNAQTSLGISSEDFQALIEYIRANRGILLQADTTLMEIIRTMKNSAIAHKEGPAEQDNQAARHMPHAGPQASHRQYPLVQDSMPHAGSATAADFDAAAYRHAAAFFLFLIIAGLVAYCGAGWGAAIPGALSVLSAIRSCGATMAAERLRKGTYPLPNPNNGAPDSD